MVRSCPACGTVNYDDLADTCLNCSASLPPIEEEDFSLDEFENELDAPIKETTENTTDDSLFFDGEGKEAPADDLDSMLADLDVVEAPVEKEDDDALFATDEETEEEEEPGEQFGLDDIDSPYGNPAEIEEAPEVPEEHVEEEVEYVEEIENPYGTPEEVSEEPIAPPVDDYSAAEAAVLAELDDITADPTTPEQVEYAEAPVEYEEVPQDQVEVPSEEEVVYTEEIEEPAVVEAAEEAPPKKRRAKRTSKKTSPDLESQEPEEELPAEPAEEAILTKNQRKALKKKEKRDAKIIAMERELEAIAGLEEGEATPESFWLLNIISLIFFVGLALFVLTEFMLLMFNISASAPMALFALSPIVGDTLGTSVLFIAVALAGIDAVLHLWDKKTNLLLSFIPTSLMIVGLGVGAYEGYVGDVDIWLLYILLMALLAFLAIDVIAWLEYPEFLQDVGRESLDTYIEASQKVGDIRSEIEQEYEEILAEEEEKLRIKEQEINEIKSEIEILDNQLSEEEEKIRLKDEEIASIQSELEVQRDDLMEEEEKLRIKEESLDSVVKAEVERYSQDWVAEEEEKIRIKEEELARTRSDLDIQKSMAEDMKERLRMKEYELSSVRTELESQLRDRLEEEEMLRIKETAARMGDTDKKKRTLFPFTAMVGQHKMKRALTLNAIFPGVGGVLIRGQKGTGKSVSVRGLAEVLPTIKVTGCKFNCDPEEEDTLCYECRRRLEIGKLETFERPVQVVDLPLNVTEDRLVGSIDIEKILSEGTKSFEPGILAEAHRGILYVDEINLLDDYIVDILLDAASSGQVVIEREGVSVNHPSHFIIVGSMNPEEGELRPQILDRIALQTDVVGIHEIESRMDIVKRRDEFTKDAQEFRKKFEPEQVGLRKNIEDARRVLPRVATPERMLTLIARLCVDFDVDGHRADIIIERAARANASFEGRAEVTSEDVIAAAEMALPHRMRTRPYAEERFDTDVLKKWVKKIETEV